MRVAILTISDSAVAGTRDDTSGQAIQDWCAKRGDEVVRRMAIADDSSEIVRRLLEWCDGLMPDLLLTTGGTGLSARDVTPEATRAVIEREAPGIAERIRVSCMESFPRAALSRGLSGARGTTLIVNLPGSTSGVKDALAALDPIVSHATDVLSGRVTSHGEPDDVNVAHAAGGEAE